MSERLPSEWASTDKKYILSITTYEDNEAYAIICTNNRVKIAAFAYIGDKQWDQAQSMGLIHNSTVNGNVITKGLRGLNFSTDNIKSVMSYLRKYQHRYPTGLALLLM